MKKISVPCLLLAVLLVMQCAFVPVHAAQVEETVSPTEETMEPMSDIVDTMVAYGTASVNTGCRTIEALVPLGGSDRMLSSAMSAFVYERNTNTVIYSYNADSTVQAGTFAKLVTAMVAIENGNLDDEVTVSTANYRKISGLTSAGLKEGEVLTLRDLLHLMIMTWYNDATLTIAEHIAGSEEVFVTMMNEWVRKIGCVATVFTNCHGLGNTSQTTTARDMTRIVEAATKNSTFAELFAITSYDVPATNKAEERKLKCLNYLMEQTIVPKYNHEDVTGGFAHYNANSGASLVCTAEKNGLSLVIVIMGCERKTNPDKSWVVEYYGNYEEVWELLEYSFNNYKVCRLLHDGQAMTQFAVADGENDVVAQTHTTMDAVLPIDAKLDTLILKYAVANGGLVAPIQRQQQIANLQIWYRTSCIAETELYAMSSIRSATDSQLNIQGKATRDDSNIGDVLSFLGVVCLIILVPLAIYLFVNNLRRTIARNRRRRRRMSRRRSR